MSSRLWRAAAILVPSLLLAGLAAAGSAAAATPAPPGLVTSNFACTNGICEVGPGNVGLSFAAGLNGTGGPTYYGPDCPYVLSVVSGSLPPGLQLGGVCGNLLEGIPATAGTYPFTVQIQSMPYPIGQSGPTTGTQQLTVTIGTGSSDRLVLTGAGWNGHTRTLSVTGYDANAGALYSLSVTKTGKQIIAPSPAPGGFRGMAKSATPYPCPTASGCSLTVTDSLGTSATVNLGPPKY